MSRIIYNLSESFYVRNAIRIVVPSIQLKFSDFVRSQLSQKNLSYRKVAEKSGGLITHSTVGDVINEKVNTISVDLIIGLAKGIGITEQELFDVARGKSPGVSQIADERFGAIAKRYSLVSEANRQNLEPLISVLEQTINHFIHDVKPDGKETLRSKVEKYFVENSDEDSDVEEIKKPSRRKAS